MGQSAQEQMNAIAAISCPTPQRHEAIQNGQTQIPPGHVPKKNTAMYQKPPILYKIPPVLYQRNPCFVPKQLQFVLNTHPGLLPKNPPRDMKAYQKKPISYQKTPEYYQKNPTQNFYQKNPKSYKKPHICYQKNPRNLLENPPDVLEKKTETPHFLPKNPPYFTKKAKRLDYHVKPPTNALTKKNIFIYKKKKQPYQT